MNDTQALTFELLIILAILIVIVSTKLSGFWSTLFKPQPFTIAGPKLPAITIDAKTGLKLG